MDKKSYWWLSILLSLSGIAFADNNDLVNSDQIYGASSTTSAQGDSRFTPRTDLSTDQRLVVLERQMDNINRKMQAAPWKDLQTQLTDLQGRVDTLEHDLHALQDQVKQQYQDIDKRLQDMSAKPVRMAASSGANAPLDASSKLEKNENELADPDQASSKDSAAEQSLYQKAFNLLKKKDYVRAIPAFENFLSKYPRGGFSPNAHFWLAEIYLMQNQTDDAISEYMIVVKSFPTSDKVQMAQLKLGFAYRDRGKKALSRAQFKKVIKLYPNTQAAKIASKQLASVS